MGARSCGKPVRGSSARHLALIGQFRTIKRNCCIGQSPRKRSKDAAGAVQTVPLLPPAALASANCPIYVGRQRPSPASDSPRPRSGHAESKHPGLASAQDWLLADGRLFGYPQRNETVSCRLRCLCVQTPSGDAIAVAVGVVIATSPPRMAHGYPVALSLRYQVAHRARHQTSRVALTMRGREPQVGATPGLPARDGPSHSSIARSCVVLHPGKSSRITWGYDAPN